MKNVQLKAASCLYLAFLVIAVVCLCLFKDVLAYSVNLESANLKMCFYENLNVTESFGINYELIPEPGGINSGKKYVDLEVYDQI